MASKTTNVTVEKAASIVKLAALTGAAKDDQLSSAIAGVSDLNVLANDPGSAVIYSLTQDVSGLAGTAQFPVSTSAETLKGATISVNTDGTIHYDASALDLAALAEGELLVDSFVYTIRMANGTLSTATATVTTTGVNDAPTLAPVSATAINDTAADDQPAALPGQLVGHDVDHGAVLTYSLADGVDGKSAYGDLTVNADGSYSFAVNADALNALAAGENETVSFNVVVTDEHGAKSGVQTITYNLVGANDTAEISGAATGDVTEDGTLTANGTLTVADRDHDQSAFAAVDANALHGTYGDFTFDHGVWTYALRNGDANVQALIAGQQVSDKLTVTSLDGSTSQDIVVTINGADEPVVPPTDGDKPPVDPNGAVTRFMVTQGTSFINNRAIFEGFDGNDKVVYANNYDFNHDITYSDFNNDGHMDSLLSFTEPHGNQTTVEIVLLGYASLTDAQVVATNAA
ncbi:VCBS domain-containing protein [Candidatus Methylobacter oryzae]|uniref:RapA2 cadherin-like domain-containing protein n=1 Tax=Candidatus Methylobacter oryzae TaxID=2497749 RepID=A0ABY3CCM0_9GAMM|nr:VCBS domain-containing protein [Candidatus Methylobacter oryzae]TRW99875.1 hypothetical protein EKO24_006455 [Candidatus Methylobacter oryzae]